MIIFSNAMHVLGLLGAPRRTPLGDATYVPEEWNGHLLRASIGGAILLVSVIMYGVVDVQDGAGTGSGPAAGPTGTGRRVDPSSPADATLARPVQAVADRRCGSCWSSPTGRSSSTRSST